MYSIMSEFLLFVWQNSSSTIFRSWTTCFSHQASNVADANYNKQTIQYSLQYNTIIQCTICGAIASEALADRSRQLAENRREQIRFKCGIKYDQRVTIHNSCRQTVPWRCSARRTFSKSRSSEKWKEPAVRGAGDRPQWPRTVTIDYIQSLWVRDHDDCLLLKVLCIRSPVYICTRLSCVHVTLKIGFNVQ